MTRGIVRNSVLVLAAMAVVSAAASVPASAQVGPGPTVRLEPVVPYRQVDGMNLTMDVYTPPGAGPFPGVELIHGGGFTGGTQQFMAGLARFLAQHGFIAFNIEYRLAPQFPYPAAVQDAEAAVRFVRDNAERFRVNPQRIAAFGASAGGSIAASVAAEPHGPLDAGDRVAALVTWSAVFDFRTVLSDPRASDYVFGSGGGSPDSPKAAAASPITHVTCDDPPAFVANSLNDRVPLHQAQEWVAALKKKKIPEELLTPPQGHAVQYSAQAKLPTLQFLQQWLRDAPISSRCQRSTSTPTTQPTPSSDGTGPPSPTGNSNGKTTVLLIVLIGVVVVLVGLALWTPRMRRVGRLRR